MIHRHIENGLGVLPCEVREREREREIIIKMIHRHIENGLPEKWERERKKEK